MSMFDVSRVSVEVGGDEISFETGKLARQASGAVVVRSGDTMVLCTATAGNDRDVDFLFLPREGEGRREGHPDRADDRPSAAPSVPEGLAPRDPACLPAAFG